MANNEKWTFNHSEDGDWGWDDFPTKQEAITAGIEEAKEQGWTELYVGKMVDTPLDYSIDVDDVIERMAEHIDENYGGDWDPGEIFLRHINDGDKTVLQDLLNKALDKWIEKCDIKSHSFLVDCIEQVLLPEEGADGE